MPTKPSFVKRMAEEIYAKYSNRIVNDFEANKRVIGEILKAEYPSWSTKKIRNMIAGYLTRKKNRETKASSSAKKA